MQPHECAYIDSLRTLIFTAIMAQLTSNNHISLILNLNLVKFVFKVKPKMSTSNARSFIQKFFVVQKLWSKQLANVIF